MSLLDEVKALLPSLGGTAGLTLQTRTGAGALAWDPITPEEKRTAECVILKGRKCFGALCRVGGKVRYLGGLNSDQPDSRLWPDGEAESLEEALEIAVRCALDPYDLPPGK